VLGGGEKKGMIRNLGENGLQVVIEKGGKCILSKGGGWEGGG